MLCALSSQSCRTAQKGEAGPVQGCSHPLHEGCSGVEEKGVLPKSRGLWEGAKLEVCVRLCSKPLVERGPGTASPTAVSACVPGVLLRVGSSPVGTPVPHTVGSRGALPSASDRGQSGANHGHLPQPLVPFPRCCSGSLGTSLELLSHSGVGTGVSRV